MIEWEGFKNQFEEILNFREIYDDFLFEIKFNKQFLMNFNVFCVVIFNYF